MSTTQDRGDFVFQCDTPKCGATLETLTGNFESARSSMRQHGWKPFKFVGRDEWGHRCKACLQAGAST